MVIAVTGDDASAVGGSFGFFRQSANGFRIGLSLDGIWFSDTIRTITPVGGGRQIQLEKEYHLQRGLGGSLVAGILREKFFAQVGAGPMAFWDFVPGDIRGPSLKFGGNLSIGVVY